MANETLAQYQEEFGSNFDLGFDLNEYPDLVDKSYRHDVAPSFYFNVDGQYFTLWVDYLEPTEREYSEAKRYTILKAYNDGENGINIVNESVPAVFETESVDKLKDKLNEMLEPLPSLTL